MKRISVTMCSNCPLVSKPDSGRSAWWCAITKPGPWRGQTLRVRAHPYEVPEDCPLREDSITIAVELEVSDDDTR